MAAEKAYSNLEISVQDALKHRSEWFEGVHNCKETDSLWTVMEAIVKAEVKSNQIQIINQLLYYVFFILGFEIEENFDFEFVFFFFRFIG